MSKFWAAASDDSSSSSSSGDDSSSSSDSSVGGGGGGGKAGDNKWVMESDSGAWFVVLLRLFVCLVIR
jgi:hypothetical protein